MPLAAFTDSRHVKAEEAIYASSCKCSQLVEAHRAALHASLERVLVIDIRFRWNGLGNSLERWERLLRVGLAGVLAPPPLLLPHCVAYRRAAAVTTSAAACSASEQEAEAEAVEDDAAEAALGLLTRQLRVATSMLG